MRVKAERSEVVKHTFYDDNTAIDVGVVTVTATNDQSEQVFELVATKNGTTYSITLPAQDENTGRLRLAWVGNQTEFTYIDIVGNHLFELNELISFVPNKGFDTSEYTSESGIALLKSIRDTIAETFERICGTSFVTVTNYEKVYSSNGSARLKLRNVLELVSVDGDDFTGTWRPAGLLTGLSTGLHDVVYRTSQSTHSVVPEDIRQAALEYASALLNYRESNIPDNVETLSTDGGTYRYVVPGRGTNYTGIPRVDAVLKRYAFRDVGIY